MGNFGPPGSVSVFPIRIPIQLTKMNADPYNNVQYEYLVGFVFSQDHYRRLYRQIKKKLAMLGWKRDIADYVRVQRTVQYILASQVPFLLLQKCVATVV